jgi:predicted nucleotidyltransferase
VRLTGSERDVILDEARGCFGPGTRVILFGSRADDSRRGGDIDLLVEGTWNQHEAFERKIRFLVGVKSRLGDQRIDVIVASPDDRRAIVDEAVRGGVAL